MGEAILTRAGSSKDPNMPVMKWVTHTDIITSNTTYVVPNNIRNKELTVTVFGGGGGHAYVRNVNARYGGGGGGGYMNRNTFIIDPGTSVDVIIGKGGSANRSGGTTSFGSWVAANGGGPGYFANGGNGGSGGGAGGFFDSSNGGDGLLFGGGGCQSSNSFRIEDRNNSNKILSALVRMTKIRPGYGGTYGGDGGCGIGYHICSLTTCLLTDSNYYEYISNPNRGHGGIVSFYNNNGMPNISSYPTNGDILDEENQLLSTGIVLEIAGLAGNTFRIQNSNSRAYGFGGGGGYGGCGGNGYADSGDPDFVKVAGGGGGGYGANGGNAYIATGGGSIAGCCAGGGGGYGSKGTDGSCLDNLTYHNSNAVAIGGGGGGYGPSNYGAGSNYFVPAKSGICIIQYQTIGYE